MIANATFRAQSIRFDTFTNNKPTFVVCSIPLPVHRERNTRTTLVRHKSNRKAKAACPPETTQRQMRARQTPKRRDRTTLVMGVGTGLVGVCGHGTGTTNGPTSNRTPTAVVTRTKFEGKCDKLKGHIFYSEFRPHDMT